MNKLLAFCKRFLALSLGLLVFFACHISSTQETEETFTFPTLKDKIAGADHVNITLKDTLGNPIDVLYNGPVDSNTSFRNLSAKNYHGGKVIIDIEAKQGTVVIYSVERNYDASKGGNQGQIVLIAPNMGVDFKLPTLRIREGEVFALPEIVILPADLGNKGLLWISRAPQILEVAGQTLKALVPGKATLVVRLQADSTKMDSLEVEVFSKTDPVKPINSLHLLPDTLRLALKGPEGRFTVRTAPTTASPAATWASLHPSLFSVDSTGLCKPLAEGLGRVVAVSKFDAAVSDTAFVLVLPPLKVDSVRFLTATTDLFVGGAAESLVVQVYPPLANPAVTLTAEDASLVSVSGQTLRGLKEGETRVVARSVDDPSKVDTLAVVLFPAERVDSVRIKPDSVKLYVRGESQTLSATLHPTTLQPRFLWKSADSKVVTVDAQGKVSPMAVGKTYVSATSRADGEKRDSALVIVKLDMPRLQVGQDTIISAGITLTHRPVVTQDYGLVVRFKWDLNGDGTFEDSSTTAPPTLSYLYGEVKDYKVAFYVRDSEGNDTVYNRQVQTVTGRVVQINAPKDGSYTNVTPIPVSWTVDGQPQSSPQALNPGVNTVTREARDSAGKVFSHSITVNLDQTPPNRPTVKASPLPVNILTPGFTWMSGGGGGSGTYRYRLDNTDLSTGTVTTDTFHTAPSNLTEGAHTLYVQERDEAGNWSASGSAQIRIDTTAPGTPGVTVNPSGTTNDTRPTWSWAGGTGDAHRYYRYKFGNDDFRSGGKDTTGTSFRPPAALAEGLHTLFVQVRDSAGNWSTSGSASVTVDIQAPAAPKVNVASALTNDATPTWTWTTTTTGTVMFRHKFDSNLDVGATTTTDKSFTPSLNLAEGTHTLYVQERDAAGNWSNTASKSIQIDLTGPSLPVFSNTLRSPSASLRPKWSWTSGGGGSGNRFRFSLDGAAFRDTISTSFQPSVNLSEGHHSLRIQELDEAGNTSEISSRAIFVSIRGYLGIPGQSVSDVFNISLKFAGNIPYTLSSQNEQMSVRAFVGNSWQNQGPGLFEGRVREAHMDINRDGVPYIAFNEADSSSKLSVMRLFGSTWSNVGERRFSSGAAWSPHICMDPNDRPFVVYRDGNQNGNLVVSQFKGFWEMLGQAGLPNGGALDYSLGFLKNGDPVLAFISNEDTRLIVVRYSFSQRNWDTLGTISDNEGRTDGVRLVVSDKDVPIIAFWDRRTSKISVMRWDGNTWIDYGNAGMPDSYLETPGLTLSDNQDPIIAFPNNGEDMRIAIMTLEGSTWNHIGPSALSDGWSGNISLEINANGVPHAAFRDGAYSGGISVFKTSYDP